MRKLGTKSQLPPIRINKYRDYPGGIVVETLPTCAGGVGWTPGQGTPNASWCGGEGKETNK